MISYIKSKLADWLQERRYLANSTIDPRGFQRRVYMRLEQLDAKPYEATSIPTEDRRYPTKERWAEVLSKQVYDGREVRISTPTIRKPVVKCKDCVSCISPCGRGDV